jgi:hypothetical protein
MLEGRLILALYAARATDARVGLLSSYIGIQIVQGISKTRG